MYVTQLRAWMLSAVVLHQTKLSGMVGMSDSASAIRGENGFKCMDRRIRRISANCTRGGGKQWGALGAPKFQTLSLGLCKSPNPPKLCPKPRFM